MLSMERMKMKLNISKMFMYALAAAFVGLPSIAFAAEGNLKSDAVMKLSEVSAVVDGVKSELLKHEKEKVLSAQLRWETTPGARSRTPILREY